MRQIAAQDGCQPSTVLRRIRRVEDLRDIPEWDHILSAVEDHLGTEQSPDFSKIDRQTVLTALNLTARRVEREFKGAFEALADLDCFLLCGDFPKAAVIHGEKTVGSMPRVVLLAALAFGWLTLLAGSTDKMRCYKPTTAAPGCTQMLAQIPQFSALEVLHKRNPELVTIEHLSTGKSFQVAYLMRGATTGETYRKTTAHIPPRLLCILEEVCGKGAGFEAVERKMNLPARSAKVLAVAALEVFAHPAQPSIEP
ncbi:hypothetical protein GFB49_11540 [Epibacterium sp. SM1979]|uniref:DUF6456 domain-containing protein n=1 Tax=Tritonibacter litoralis TaxID=2662264 RepID=A0A843YIW0_9RHOB|nr:DUF6456 domain-containing protein [Tritonibacter litoralis]MQQ09089.1 hypothetical protein [Tritonibacter litoralis]